MDQKSNQEDFRIKTIPYSLEVLETIKGRANGVQDENLKAEGLSQREIHELKYKGVGKNNRGLNIQLYSGKPFYPEDPRAEDIDIIDIAHALSLTNRFGGHTLEPYPVSQHSVLLSELVEEKNAFAALMHDAPEYIVGDLVRPVKYRCPNFETIENKIHNCIFDKYGIDRKIPDQVKDEDVRICFTERRDLTNYTGETDWGNEMQPHFIKIKPWPWKKAKRKFIERFNELCPEEFKVDYKP